MTSELGLGSYAFFWEGADALPDGGNRWPLPLAGQLVRTAELGLGLFQICDYAPLLGYSAAELREVRAVADDLGIRLELGTKGVAPGHLRSFLGLAETLGARYLRSMVFAPDCRPTLAEAERTLRELMPAFDAAGVTLGLETYEQVSSADLVGLVEAVGADGLGICLDPANTVAGLENPREVVERCAPYVNGIHVKDFAFTRRDGWVGFTLAGTRMGEGLLDYAHLVETVRPAERGITRIVEHWLPWQGDLESTVALERDWTTHNVGYLKEN
ncbi:sugar phosphate isomerase/epimerase family protein [Protaetiibacter intestinalis]|uniref:Sugar phosphate isomerase/epimerase n=1 Tax=Protaetiibacter intestinalis TaxID=2419774 RepID=A0A387B4J5_9MICO|nr:TIM barrel protein [Protaetiibacter intestinalis]AYF97343.1 sugar phosphate isomerase/epimerase [Protaetiibacter intestinalis]